MSIVIAANAAPLYTASTHGFPTVEVKEPIWREVGTDDDPRAILKGIWTVNDLSLHVIALAVHIDEAEGTMEMDEGVEGYDIDELWVAHGMAGPAETAVIDGRHYLVFASPFCT